MPKPGATRKRAASSSDEKPTAPVLRDAAEHTPRYWIEFLSPDLIWEISHFDGGGGIVPLALAVRSSAKRKALIEVASHETRIRTMKSLDGLAVAEFIAVDPELSVHLTEMWNTTDAFVTGDVDRLYELARSQRLAHVADRLFATRRLDLGAPLFSRLLSFTNPLNTTLSYSCIQDIKSIARQLFGQFYDDDTKVASLECYERWIACMKWLSVLLKSGWNFSNTTDADKFMKRYVPPYDPRLSRSCPSLSATHEEAKTLKALLGAQIRAAIQARAIESAVRGDHNG